MNVSVGDRDGDREIDCYIDLLSTHIVIPYSGPYVFASLVRSSQPRSTAPPPGGA